MGARAAAPAIARARARWSAIAVTSARIRIRGRVRPKRAVAFVGSEARDVALDGGSSDGMDDDDAPSVEIAARATHWVVERDFLPGALARAVRGRYDDVFEDATRARGERFCWDLWHVPKQYTLLRTPAEDFFGEELHGALEEMLMTYARERLGCASMTPMWMSCYVHGMRQELHADVPHGPFAFVLSLTRESGADGGFTFSGGETQIMRPERLNYWRNFDSSEVVERAQIMETISPRFNQLVVFDPRLPHGVTEVFGTQDIRDGRLVLHGWFKDPEPSFSGALSEEDAAETLETALAELYARLVELPRASGVVCARIKITPSGDVDDLTWTCDTLTPIPLPELPSETDIRDAIMLDIASALLELKFPPRDGSSVITLPFCFE